MLQPASRQVRFNVAEDVPTLELNRQLCAPQTVRDEPDGVAQFETLPGSKHERPAPVLVIELLCCGGGVLPGIEWGQKNGICADQRFLPGLTTAAPVERRFPLPGRLA